MGGLGMIAVSSLSIDALHIYAITRAYLYGAKIGNEGSTKALHVQEISPDRFFIWQRKPPAKQSQVDVCTYNPVDKTWNVKLASGERLTLLDKGHIWELVEETKKKPARKGEEVASLRNGGVPVGARHPLLK